MAETEITWEHEQCPEQDAGTPHDPRAIDLEREASPGQTEIEINVRCRACGQLGLLCVAIDLSSIQSYAPQAGHCRAMDGASCVAWAREGCCPHVPERNWLRRQPGSQEWTSRQEAMSAS